MSIVPYDIVTSGPKEGKQTIKQNTWKYYRTTWVIKAAIKAAVFSKISESIHKTKYVSDNKGGYYVQSYSKMKFWKQNVVYECAFSVCG